MSKKNSKTEFQKRRSWLAKLDDELKQKDRDKKTSQPKETRGKHKSTKEAVVETEDPFV